MKCQYHAVTSMTIRRVSGGRRNHDVIPAYNSATMPPMRWAACSPVRIKKNPTLIFTSASELPHPKLLPREVLPTKESKAKRDRDP